MGILFDKLQGRRFRHANSKNIVCCWMRSKIFERIGRKCEFLKISKNVDISTVDSGKTVAFIKEKIPEAGKKLMDEG